MKTNQKNLDDNLTEKKLLIEKLKELLIIDGSINDKYKEFKKLQNSWFKIGNVPRSQNLILWNNFQHHIKNFYDYLHLNRKFKEIDLEHNLKEKEKIIFNAKKLINNNDQYKASRDFDSVIKKFGKGTASWNDVMSFIVKDMKNWDEGRYWHFYFKLMKLQ